MNQTFWRLARVLCLVLAMALLAGCGGAAKSETPKTDAALQKLAALGTPTDDLYRTSYEIFVYSFCDSDGDGIGDLKGVESKLDYLEVLGVDGIWFMPISPSPSYHKYDVIDYTAIDPQYGTMEDFDSLLAACHERGIRVILDFVVNHTSSEHPWFTAAVDYLKTLPAGQEPNAADCPTIEYYVFNHEGGNGYHKIEGTDWYYECDFSAYMPDLNWDCPAVYEEIEAAMRYWLEKGVDGFRLDAAKHYYTGQTDKNVAVLHWLQTTAEKYNPEAYLVAEVWDSSNVIANYYASGINSIFDYSFGNHDGRIIKTLRAIGVPSMAKEYAAKIESVEASYREKNPDYIGAPFLSNHDTGRIANFVGGDEALVKLAGAMNLLMYGNAFVYYGEEIGMRQGATDDPSYRAPMLWNEARADGVTDCPPGCTLPESYFFGSVEEQLKQDGSVLNYYRQAIALRKALPVISHGTTTKEEALNTGCVAAERKTWNSPDGVQECLVLYNFDTEIAQLDVSGYAGWQLAAGLSVAEEEPALKDGTLTLPAYGVAVLLPAA